MFFNSKQENGLKSDHLRLNLKISVHYVHLQYGHQQFVWLVSSDRPFKKIKKTCIGSGTKKFTIDENFTCLPFCITWRFFSTTKKSLDIRSLINNTADVNQCFTTCYIFKLYYMQCSAFYYLPNIGYHFFKLFIYLFIYLFILITQARICFRINWQWVVTDVGLHSECLSHISRQPPLKYKADLSP